MDNSIIIVGLIILSVTIFICFFIDYLQLKADLELTKETQELFFKKIQALETYLNIYIIKEPSLFKVCERTHDRKDFE